MAGGKPKSRPTARKAKKGPPVIAAFGVFAVLVVAICAASFFQRQGAGDDGAATRKPQPTRPEQPKPLSNARMLQHFNRMSSLAKELQAIGTGKLDAATVQGIDRELTAIAQETAAHDDQMGRQLHSTISVIRGQIYQMSSSPLTEEQAEKMKQQMNFDDPRYWDEHYKTMKPDERYNWCGTWDSEIPEVSFTPLGRSQPISARTIGDILRPYLSEEGEVLMLGCGNSDMSEKMYQAGFEKITNIDSSADLISVMREQYNGHPNMRWLHANATALADDWSGAFATCVDKSTLDAVEQDNDLLAGVVREAYRTLRSGGFFLSITFHDEKHRVTGQLLKLATWEECTTHLYGRERDTDSVRQYYVHVCRKP